MIQEIYARLSIDYLNDVLLSDESSVIIISQGVVTLLIILGVPHSMGYCFLSLVVDRTATQAESYIKG